MASRSLALVCVTFAAVFAAVVSGLHEDEQGKYDWLRPGLGHARLAAFHPPSKSLKSVYVATGKGVVASFALASGEMRWRNVLGSNESVRCIAPADAFVFAAVASSNVLYAFDAKTGAVKRTLNLPGAPLGCGVSGGNVFVVMQLDEKLSYASIPTGESELRRFEQLVSQPLALDATKLHGAEARSASVAANGAFHVLTSTSTLLSWKSGEYAAVPREVALQGVSPWATLKPDSCDQSVAIASCKSSLSFNAADGSVKALESTSILLGCDATTSPTLSVDSNGFVNLAGQPTGLRERVNSRPEPLAVRAGEKGRVEALLASSSGSIQYIKVKDGNEVVSQWSFEGGLGDIAFGLFPAKHRNALAESTRVVKFGLNDRLIVGSRYGMLFSLLTNDGRNETEWRAFAAGDATIHYPQTRNKCFSVKSVTDEGELIVARIAFRDDEKTVVQLSYDVYTGKLVSHAAKASRDAAVFLPDGAIVDAAGRVSGSPLLVERDYFTMNKSAGHIEGFSIASNATTAYPAWTVSLGAEIAAYAIGSSALRSLATVRHLRYLPNETTKAHDIKRRYPMANVLVTCHFEAPLDDEDVSPTLVVNAFDAISGQVLGTMRHREVEGKVVVTIVEHMIVYHFLRTASMRYAVGVWELFEHQDGLLQDSQYTSPALIAMSFFEKRREFSGIVARPPQIHAQLLDFPAGSISALGATASQQGIARKQMIFVSATGRVMAVPVSHLEIGGPKNVVQDPKKPLPKATIIVPSTSILSYKYSVKRAEFVFSAPSPLESTSHILVAGLDLFYTRVSSGKPFDMLDDEFNYTLLIGMCIALPVLSVIMRYVSERRALTAAWA